MSWRALLIAVVLCLLTPELKFGPTNAAEITLHAQSAAIANELPPTLTATVHPPLPGEFSDVWLVPDERPSAAVVALGRAVSLIEDAKYTEAASALAKATLDDTPLASYRQYYAGLLAFRAGRQDEAKSLFDALLDRNPRGYLAEAVRSLSAVAHGRGLLKAGLDEISAAFTGEPNNCDIPSASRCNASSTAS